MAKAKLEEEQRRRAIKERAEEKKAQLEERARIRERIAADKEARLKKFNMPGAGGPSAAAPAAASAASAAPAGVLAQPATGGKIQFRMPDGSRIEGTFGSDATVAQAAGFVAKARPDLAASGFELSSQYPKKVFSEADMLSELADFKLLPRGALNVTAL